MIEKDMYNAYVEHIQRILDDEISKGKVQFVLYPNGEIAQIVKNILIEKYKILPLFAVDNIHYDNENIFDLQQAATKTQNNKDVYYLVCSDNAKVYDEIRNKLKQHIMKEQIVELFDDSDLETEIMDVFKNLDVEIERMVKSYACV